MYKVSVRPLEDLLQLSMELERRFDGNKITSAIATKLFPTTTTTTQLAIINANNKHM